MKYTNHIPVVTIVFPSIEGMYPQIIKGVTYLYPDNAPQKMIVNNEYGENVNKPRAVVITAFELEDFYQWEEGWTFTYEEMKAKYDCKGPNKTWKDITDVMFPKCNLCGVWQPYGCRECNALIGRSFTGWD